MDPPCLPKLPRQLPAATVFLGTFLPAESDLTGVSQDLLQHGSWDGALEWLVPYPIPSSTRAAGQGTDSGSCKQTGVLTCCEGGLALEPGSIISRGAVHKVL